MEKSSDISRNKEHELALFCIYDALTLSESNTTFNVEELMEGIYKLPFNEIPLFSKQLVVKSLSHINEIIPKFQDRMPNWKFSRLNSLEKALLIMSYTNGAILKEANKKVVINTAINLSKKYLDKDDYKFVNAILDKLL